MVTVLRRMLWRDLRASSILLLAVTAIIAIGVMCFIAMQSAYFNLRQAMDSYYRDCRMADFWLDLKKIPVAEIPTLLRVPGVAQWRERIQFAATVDMPGYDYPINARVLSLPDVERPVLNDIVLRRGGHFSNRRANEVIVNDAFARRHHLAPGGRLTLIINNRRQELWIVGTAISSEFTYMLDAGALIPDPERFGVFFVKRQFAEEIYDMSGAANQIVGTLTSDGRARSEAVLRQLEQRLAEYGVFAALPRRLQSSHQFLSNEINGLKAFASVMPLIFLVTAALVLNVLLGRIARQQRTVVGTLKALGHSSAAVFRHFLAYGFCVGLVGGLAGSGLGYLASSGMTLVYRHYFEFPYLPSNFYPVTHAIGMTVSLSCALIGGLRAARAMLRLQPAAAMRPEPPRRGGAVFLERVPWIWMRLGSAWRMALRNVLRGRWRTLVTVFSSAAGAALLANGFMFIEAQFFLLDFQFDKVTSSDVDVLFTSERGREAWDELRRVPGAVHVEPVFDLGCTMVHGHYRRLSGVKGLLPSARLTTPRDDDGRVVELPESGLVLNRQLAERLGVSPGDRLQLLPVKGDRRPREALVARLSDSYIGMAAYANIYYLSRVMGEDLVLTGAQLQTAQDPESERRIYRELKAMPGIQSVQARRDMVTMLRRTLLQNQQVFIGVLVAFAGSVFFGSILNASFVSLHERRREIASLRALGYAPHQIGTVFLREALCINLAGSILGIPTAYILVWLTALAYDSEFFRLPVVSAPWVPAATIGLGMMFTLLAHAVVYRSIVDLRVREALNVRE